jgi:UDP-glucose 4-epimerase
MRILVTGGAGFIGSNLVHSVLTGGHDVAIVDDLSTGSIDNLDPRAYFRRLDILDDGLRAVFEEFKPEAVVHLAAQASVSASVRDPERDRAVNAEGPRRVASIARDTGVSRVVSASSAAVYGAPTELPLTEKSSTVPMNPYGASKLEAESLLASELDGSATDYASFRFSNVYGPRQDAQGEGGVIAIFCDRMGGGNPPVVFGDGTQTRDFIYVGDIVNALISALLFEGKLARGDGSAYNISTGERISVNELLMTLRTIAGYFGEIDYEAPREGDIVHSALDANRAAEVFGWKANVALETGLAMTWRWFAHR